MPDQRTRPSVLIDVLPCAFDLVNTFNKSVMSPNLHAKFHSAIEQAVQDENDE